MTPPGIAGDIQARDYTSLAGAHCWWGLTVPARKSSRFVHVADDPLKSVVRETGLMPAIMQKIKLPVHVADDPLKSVVRGTGLALKHYDRYPFVMR